MSGANMSQPDSGRLRYNQTFTNPPLSISGIRFGAIVSAFCFQGGPVGGRVCGRAPIFARLGGPASAPLRFLTELLPHTFVKRWPKRILTSNSCLSDSGRHECKLRFTRSLHDLTRLAHHPVRGSTWTTMLKGMFCQSPLQPNPV